VRRDISIQPRYFDPGELQRQLASVGDEVGAVACFTGYVRNANEQAQVLEMELEHYPGMTEASLGKILDEAESRWPLMAVSVVHRIGSMVPGDQIVFVGVASSHRGAAFSACEFIMDFLKTRAPFWKKETLQGGQRWVESRNSDEEAARRWDA
jgi:molybdopterin synthase catalytic subunit